MVFFFAGYLKLWQMSQPQLRGYDVIMLDEAQDCTECMRGILEGQLERCALVLVGDSHQQIYGFRLASDALVTMPASDSYYLTQVRLRFNRKRSFLALMFRRTIKKLLDIIQKGRAGKPAAYYLKQCFFTMV